eukprot:NODE_3645_length_646_cov_112.015075_g2609_i0.p1 GENE.NODE_3645_length_646_cov_112.015075_g2609_i0~~NODE_3645_length_646_cov_112.015075_g2609_i0.p1  ORF type:complete len:100 (+),score=5.96 NODE_3645_length_646_cov_112.015075_g2609_i0:40-300(+)
MGSDMCRCIYRCAYTYVYDCIHMCMYSFLDVKILWVGYVSEHVHARVYIPFVRGCPCLTVARRLGQLVAWLIAPSIQGVLSLSSRK